MVCLQPSTWLNDEVINFYMEMLNDRNKAHHKKSHFFNSFFVERLLKTDKKYTYTNVQRWSKKFDIFELDKIFFPINIDNMHWTLALVEPQLKLIHYFDSMRGKGEFYMKGLMRWIKDEAKDSKRATKGWPRMDPKEMDWELVSHSNEIPQQGNSFDCGMFTLIAADFLSDDLEFSYNQGNMPFFREKICYQIFKGELGYPL